MSNARPSNLVIETPEGVVFSFELATPVIRSLAWGVDAAVIGTAGYVIGHASSALRGLNQDWANAISVVLFFVFSLLYGIVLEWRWRGQTIGKRLFHLRVVDVHGLHLQLSQIVLRNLLRVVDILPALYLVGAVTCLFTRNCQRLGDLAASTIVARELQDETPDLEQVASAKYNSLLAYPNLAARLRSLASPRAAGLAARAIAHREGYDPIARVALFAELAAYFRTLVEFPEDSLEGLTDEQYVRSVLCVIYGAATK
jgi:uncharacterized RDD family membrane protein YckC